MEQGKESEATDVLTPDPELQVVLTASEFALAGGPASPESTARGLRALVHAHWMGWAEKRQAQRTTRAVVARYRDILARQPPLPTREALSLLVMEHLRCDARSARRILANAENSFASWPSQREVNLVDVAHYLAVVEFLALHRGERGIRSDLGALVAALVPRELLQRAPR